MVIAGSLRSHNHCMCGGPSRGSEARLGAIGRWCLCAETIVSMWLIGWMAGICARSVRGLFRRGASDLRPGLGYAAPSDLGCGWGDGDLSGSFPGLANAARPGAPGVSAVAVGNFAGGMAADLFLALDVDCRNPYTKRSLEGMRTGWLLPRSAREMGHPHPVPNARVLPRSGKYSETWAPGEIPAQAGLGRGTV